MASILMPVTITDAARKLTHSGIPYVNLRLDAAWGETLWSFVVFHHQHPWVCKRILGSLLDEYEWLALSLATRSFDPDDCFFLAGEVIPHLIGKSTVVQVFNAIYGHQFRREVKWI